MVDSILQGNVQEVVVAHKDRLCRFAFDFLEWICKRGDTNLVVQEQVLRRIKPTPEQSRSLRFWMSTHRKTYNEALRLVKDKKSKVNS